MPITYEVRSGGTFVYATANGDVTNDDLLHYQAALLSDPQVRSGFDALFDARMAQGADLSETAIEKMIEVDRAHTDRLGRGKSAIVVRSDLELARDFEQRHAGPPEVMLFHNVHVALVWLGREVETP